MEKRYLAFIVATLDIFSSIIIFNESRKRKSMVEAKEIVINDYDPTVDLEVI